MKILHVIPSMSPRRGGPSFMLRGLAAGQAAAGHEVDVATTDDDGPGRLREVPANPSPEEGVRYWRFPRQIRFYTVSRPLARWLRLHSAQFDVIHLHALFTFPALAAAFWARRRRIPYLVRPLGTLSRWGVRNRRPWLKRVSFPVLERRILEGAACVHFTSRQELEEAKELRFEAPCEVVPNPIEPASVADGDAGRFLLRHPALEGRKRILYLSRLDPKKGLDLLLDAFAGLRDLDPSPVLVVAGDGEADFVAGLRRRADDLKIADRVLFTGFLEGDDKRDAFAAADAFALPSYSENFGIAAVEAMAAGLPVVISDQVAIHREVAEAKAGFVVPCDAGALGRALGEALEAGRNSPIGRRAQELACRRFALDSVVAQLNELYKRIVAGDRVAR